MSAPTDNAMAHAGDDDRVHAERDAAQAFIHPVAAQRRQRLGAHRCGALIGRRDLATRARLDELHRHVVGDEVSM